VLSTLVANVIASFLIAIICSISLNDKNSTSQLFWAIGFCGGLSTFSTFSYQSYQLFQSQQWSWLLFNIASNLILTLCAVLTGLKIASI
jgi:CrcB protein